MAVSRRVKSVEPYNPLAKKNLGKSVAEALIEQPIGPMPPTEVFAGAGIYAIYYDGEFPPYAPIASRNRGDEWTTPIYVGKAVPKGARKGEVGLDVDPGTVLFSRLREHAASVAQVGNLEQSAFRCRFLVVDDIWIPLGESLLIKMFQPLWNQVLDGFGNHDPGGRRSNQYRSPWDVIHPGRPWAVKLADHPEPASTFDLRIANRLRKLYPPM